MDPKIQQFYYTKAVVSPPGENIEGTRPPLPGFTITDFRW